MKIWLLLLLSTAVAYGGSIKYGFSQDDWYFLTMIKTESVLDVFKFFSPWHQQDFPFFRPLGTQLYYWLATTMIPASSELAMHLFMLLLQACNGYLAYRLVAKLHTSETAARWIGVLYAISSAHFLSLYYIAATQQLLAATFSLISLNFFVRSRWWLAGLWLIPALLSKESALVTPGIAATLYLLKNQKVSVKEGLRNLSPYIVCV